MADGDVTGFTVFWTIILFIFFAISFGLTIYSFFKKHWSGNKASNWKFVFSTAMSFLGGLFVGFINYIFVLLYGWSEGNISEYIFWIFTIFYTVSLFLAIYLWIKRLERVFANSSFEINVSILKLLKVVYWALVILGFITLILFFVIDNSIILWTLSGLWTLLFAVELSVLQWLFINKLVKLRKIAESTLKSSGDIQQMESLRKIWRLQVKLTILATTTIVSTVIALTVSFNIGLYYDLVPFGIDSFIGFICIYCALKQHYNIYGRICIVCIKCCDICCNHQLIHNELGTQIEVQSRTDGQSTLDQTMQSKSGLSGSSGSGGTKQGHYNQQSDAQRTTPLPSHRAEPSFPTESKPNLSTNITMTEMSSQ